jgi:DNA polymerase III epsilon subunit-like protein
MAVRQVEDPLRWFRPGYFSRRDGVARDDLEFVAVDFETTGLDAHQDRIVEVAACRFTADGTISDEYASRVDPVTAHASSTEDFHGLTEEAVRGAPPFGDTWPELSRLISGAVVVAHNLAFEDDFLRHELSRIGVDLAGRVPGVCTMVTSWSHLQMVSHKQKVLFRTVVGTWPRDAHTALGDVRNLSVIVAGFHRRMPGLRYVGPQPVSLPAAGRRGRMFARPIVEKAVQWNSLPMAIPEYPLSAGGFRAGVIQLLHARRPREALITLMDTAGVGAGQFGRALATAVVELLADGQLSWHANTQLALEDLMEIMASREFAEILTDGVRDRVPRDGLLAPLLVDERWQVPRNQPHRETLVEFLTDLGAHVLRTRRPELDARVHADRVYRDVVYDLDTYLKDLNCRAAEAGSTHLGAWATRHRQRHSASAGIPLGDRDGGEEWSQRMRFTPIDPELAPNWRWLVDPDHDESVDPLVGRWHAGCNPPNAAEPMATSSPVTGGEHLVRLVKVEAAFDRSDCGSAATQPRPVAAADELARRAALGHVGRALTALAAKIDGNQADRGHEPPHPHTGPVAPPVSGACWRR